MLCLFFQSQRLNQSGIAETLVEQFSMKDKTFTIIDIINSGRFFAISKGTFEGDTTKDGDVLISLTSATMNGEYNGIEMASDFDITEDGLFNCICKVSAMGTSI